MLSYQTPIIKKYKDSEPPLQGISSNKFKISFCSVDERVYKTISFGNKGSATIEASLIIPIFLFAAFAIFTLCNVIQTKEVIYEGMQETAQYLAEYQYAYSVLDEKISESQINFSGTNSITASAKLKEYIDNEEIVKKYVSGGFSGLTFQKAFYDSSDGYIYLTLKYDVNVNIPIVGNITWQETEQIKQKAYIGLVTDDAGSDDDDVYVYITETGDVYHKSRDCYHIKLTITQVSESSLNTTYSDYDACELCALGKTCSGNVYVTKTGGKYHYSIACSGLKRTVIRVKLKDVSGMPACSNCGG